MLGEEKAERLRDVVMAFQLCIASQATPSPLIDFPAMMALLPGGVPRGAVVHIDSTGQTESLSGYPAAAQRSLSDDRSDELVIRF